jgi:hypothetical protein
MLPRASTAPEGFRARLGPVARTGRATPEPPVRR